MPKTALGLWSLILVVAMPILLLIGPTFTNTIYAGISAGKTILQDIAARPLLALTMLAGFGCGIAAFITGLIALIKDKERAIFVYISTFIGACTVLFVIFQVVIRE